VAAQAKGGKARTLKPPTYLSEAGDGEGEGAAEASGFPVLRLTTSANGHAREKRVLLFSIDGTEYTMLAEPGAGLALRYLDKIEEDGPNAGFKFGMEAMIGAEAYQALLTYPDLTRAQFRQVSKVVTDTLLGALEEEDPKAT
jgi:hypothetical protein